MLKTRRMYIVSLMEKINPNALLIGFARRFATYKRAHLLFTDLERLSKICLLYTSQQPEVVFRWNIFVERIGTDCY